MMIQKNKNSNKFTPGAASCPQGLILVGENRVRGLFLAGCCLLAFCGPVLAADLTASWYSTESCKKEGTSGIWTASGARFNENELTAASWQYPFNTRLKVVNLRNNKSVIVKVTDRGPSKRLVRKGRVIDLSMGAFSRIADLKDGVIRIKMEVLK